MSFPPTGFPPRRRPRRLLWLFTLLLLVGGVGTYVAWQRARLWLQPLHQPAAPRAVAPRGDLAADEKATIEIFENAAPSVVYVTNLARRSDAFGLNVEEVAQGTGSGFIWDANGHVVTNMHVLEGAAAAEVTLADHTSWSARLVGYSADKDLAVLRIAAPREKLRPLAVGTSHDLKVGQKVFAIGNPFGLDHTLTTGIISALDREIGAQIPGRRIRNVIQTDAVINPGNSGGPLLDSGGRLIGVNTAIFSPSRDGMAGSIGIGFAVPVDTVNRVVPQLISHGRVVQPALGVTLADDRIVRSWGLSGALVVGVSPDGGAAAAGIKPTTRDPFGRIVLGDLIVSIDGKPVASADDIATVLESRKIGDKVAVEVQRADGTAKVMVELKALS
jgi:S1-C subfamily serine protease